MEINVFTEGNVTLPYEGMDGAACRRVIELLLQQLETTSVEINCILTDNAVIQEINRDYRNRDYPTDVISFAYRDNPFPGIELEEEPLGDVYISLERAKEQAAEFGVTFKDELYRLLVHGLLHLLGYDHENVPEQEAEKMRKAEDRLLSHLLHE